MPTATDLSREDDQVLRARPSSGDRVRLTPLRSAAPACGRPSLRTGLTSVASQHRASPRSVGPASSSKSSSRTHRAPGGGGPAVIGANACSFLDVPGGAVEHDASTFRLGRNVKIIQKKPRKTPLLADQPEPPAGRRAAPARKARAPRRLLARNLRLGEQRGMRPRRRTKGSATGGRKNAEGQRRAASSGRPPATRNRKRSGRPGR